MKLLFLTIITIVFSSNLDAEPQNDSYEAEEALKNLFKDVPSDDPTIDSINDSKIYYLKCMMLADIDYRFPRTTRVMVDEGRKY